MAEEEEGGKEGWLVMEEEGKKEVVEGRRREKREFGEMMEVTGEMMVERWPGRVEEVEVVGKWRRSRRRAVLKYVLFNEVEILSIINSGIICRWQVGGVWEEV